MSPRATVAEFLSRICNRDLEGACELVTDDVECDNVPVGKRYGPQGIKDLLIPLTSDAKIQVVDWVVHRVTARGHVVMVERTDRFKVNGTWLELPVVGVFEVSPDGRIALWRNYFDLAMFQTAYAAAAQG